MVGFSYPTDDGGLREDPNHIKNNTWTGVVLSCAATPSTVPVGQIDPRTGQVVQAIYLIQDKFSNFSNGHMEVKASNIYTATPQTGTQVVNHEKLIMMQSSSPGLYNNLN